MFRFGNSVYSSDIIVKRMKKKQELEIILNQKIYLLFDNR